MTFHNLDASTVPVVHFIAYYFTLEPDLLLNYPSVRPSLILNLEYPGLEFSVAVIELVVRGKLAETQLIDVS